MNDILKIKEKKLKELDKEIAELGLKLGWDDGTGELKQLEDMYEKDELTELEKKRESKNSLADTVRMAKLTRERRDLAWEIERIKTGTEPQYYVGNPEFENN